MRPVPDAVADLAKRALAVELTRDLVDPPAEWNWPGILDVLADWLEEGGDQDMAKYLRDWPWPGGGGIPEPHRWLKSREWVLKAVVEAHEKRDAIAALEARRRA